MGLIISAYEAGEIRVPRSSATSNRARSSTVETTPPAAPSPCGGGIGERTSAPVLSTWYGSAIASAKSLRNGRSRYLRAERAIPAGRRTYCSTRPEKDVPVASIIGRDAHEE